MEDTEIDMTPTELLEHVAKEAKVPEYIELPTKKYRIYVVDDNTANLLKERADIAGLTNTILAFRMYYASRTAPKGFIKFMVTGLFTKWSRWVKEIRNRKAEYGEKWYEGMTVKHIDFLKEEMTYEVVYGLITRPLREEAIKRGITSEVDILEMIKEKFHNRVMDYINTSFDEEISALLLLFPECPDHYMQLSPEFKHLNNETFTLIEEKKQEALQYYTYKELA